MEHHEHDTDLSALERSLTELRVRMEQLTAPLQQRMQQLGPAGLFALAAEEHDRAEREYHHERRRMHLDAARAAEQLADRLVAERTRL